MFRVNRYVRAHLPINDIIDKHLGGVNSITISSKINTLTDLLKNPQTPNQDKIKICRYISDNLYNIYRPSETLIQLIITTLRTIVMNDNDLNMNIRLLFLHFQNMKIAHSVAISLYEKQIRNRWEYTYYIQLLKFLLRSHMSEQVLKTTIVQELHNLFDDRKTTEFNCMDIADTLLLSGYRNEGELLLTRLRIRHNLIELKGEDKRDTVYSDSQNVHNKNINETVVKAGYYLIADYYDAEDEMRNPVDPDVVKVELSELRPLSSELIERVIERIQIDVSRFSYSSTGKKEDQEEYGMYKVFVSLWRFINKHIYKDELKLRLIEEMVAMADYCSTGHLSRFVNVIQGYTTDSKLIIKISDKDQLKSVIFGYLTKEMERAPDTIHES